MSKELSNQDRLDKRAKYIQREMNDAKNITRTVSSLHKELYISKKVIWSDFNRDLQK